MRLLLLFLITVLNAANLSAQLADINDPGTFSFSINHSRLSDEVAISSVNHRERSYALNLNYTISRRFSVLGRHTIIRSNTIDRPGELSTYRISGGAVRFNALNSGTGQFYLQLGGAIGDYCTCGEDYTSRRSGLGYVNYGLGAHIRAIGPVYVNASFEGNPIVNRLGPSVDKYAYNVLQIGVTVLLLDLND